MPMESEYLARAESAAPATGVTAEAKSAPRPSSGDADESRLGTGHGRRVDSGAVYTEFERASESPDEIIRIYYDSRRNLVARGIIPQPEPFPFAFVPDP
jgi:hypothetical protein